MGKVTRVMDDESLARAILAAAEEDASLDEWIASVKGLASATAGPRR
jgi:hypothetical protein